MASERNFRPSSARAALVAFIAAICILALLAAPVSAQSECYCTSCRVHYRKVRCYYDGPETEGEYAVLSRDDWYDIICQIEGSEVGGNSWWNKIEYDHRECYVNDHYVRTDCPTRCHNLELCH